ncbi:hypothetical protein PFICI_11202 [Pestalotiopsis fici W106-1]|uniref:Clr5 domain-containing protein n=1 Tax=Pestalotiopsis fici (strain W106-1 / CGMCC3.15140) TaxID=1229662 RepID=W3WTX7_PESFW|nr:uncharacterized protein PFICI_11202 [Pestalotiopsis fici W106-1]ETS77328.1 hypothetical protein PFICI_11202 [Pestalotiopsis fici W106-1]
MQFSQSERAKVSIMENEPPSIASGSSDHSSGSLEASILSIPESRPRRKHHHVTSGNDCHANRAMTAGLTQHKRQDTRYPVANIPCFRQQTAALTGIPHGWPTRRTRYLGNVAPMKVLEKLLFSTRSYLQNRAPLDTYPAPVSPSEDIVLFHGQLGNIEAWYSDFNPAFKLLEERKFRSAFRILQKCFEKTGTIVKSQNSFTFIFLCHQVMRCIYYDKSGHNLSRMLLRHFAGLCQAFLGADHPLCTMTDALSRMDNIEFASHIEPLLACYCEVLEPSLWRSPEALTELMQGRGLTISLMSSAGMIGYEEARLRLDHIIQTAKDCGISTMQLKIELACLLRLHNRFDEGLTLALEARDSEEARVSPHQYCYACINVIGLYAAMKDYDSAIQVSYELVDFLDTPPASATHGQTYSSMTFLETRENTLMMTFVWLENYLRKSSRVEEADRVQARREGL